MRFSSNMTPEICPTWFVGFNLAFQIIFALITTTISFTAYKAYQFLGIHRVKYLSMGFGFMAIAYVANIIAQASQVLGGSLLVAKIGLYAYAFLFLAGIMMLIFAYLKIDDLAVRSVLFILVLGVTALFSTPRGFRQDLMYYIITSVLLLFIVWQLLQKYKESVRITTFFVIVGFTLLTLGQLLLVFIVFSEIFFAASALMTLIGFLSIAASRFMLMRPVRK